MMYVIEGNERRELTPNTKLKFMTVIGGVCEECGKEFRRQYRNKPERLKQLCTNCSRKYRLMEKYGVENSAQLPSTIEKRIETNIEKYGFSHPMKSGRIKEKVKQTNIKKYGNASSLHGKEVEEKTKKTLLERYGTDCMLKLPKVRNKRNVKKAVSSSIKTNLKKYGVKSTLQLDSVKEKIKQTNLKHYGVENPMMNAAVKDRVRATSLNTYGVDWPSKTCSPVRDKIKATNIDRYGHPSPFGSSDIRKRIRDTVRAKYGVDNVFASKAIKIKIEQSNLLKYGRPHTAQVPSIRNKMSRARKIRLYNQLISGNRLKNLVTPMFNIDEYDGINGAYKWRCVKCGIEFEDNLEDGKIPRCPSCFPPLTNTSRYEDEIENWLKRYAKVERNIRIDNSEIDIYLPDCNLGIEFDGLYWHSELGGKKNRNYHLDKTNLMRARGINLIHIFEDEWIEKQDIVKSIILNKIGIIENKIFARTCDTQEVDIEMARNFLEENHLQGYVPSLIKLGLFYKNNIVAIITLGKSRYNKSAEFELLRFATKVNYRIPGAFSKLISHLDYDGSIISYADLRYFNGRSYQSAGFKYINTSTPNYYYTDYKNRYSRIGFQKHKLSARLKIFDHKLSEWQNM